MSELISVIVPAYNCDRFLEKCIISVLNQTYPNFELIIINDGSTDYTHQICLEYTKKDGRIKYVFQNNKGVSFARNKGLSLAKGSLISFIDSDDYIKEDYLLTLYTYLKNHNLDMVCCNSIDNGEVYYDIKSDTIIENGDVIFKSIFSKRRFSHCVWGKLFKKEVLFGIVFPDLKYAEDLYVVFNSMMNSKRIGLIEYAGYHYMVNSEGAMKNAIGYKPLRDIAYVHNYIFDYCKKNYIHLIKEASYFLLESVINLLIKLPEVNVQDKEKYVCNLNVLINKIDNRYLFHDVRCILIISYKISPMLTLKMIDKIKAIRKKE